jgi:hypothetical protein
MRLTPDRSDNRTFEVMLQFSGRCVYQDLACGIAQGRSFSLVAKGKKAAGWEPPSLRVFKFLDVE